VHLAHNTHWGNIFTSIGTVALACIAVLTIAVTAWLAARERSAANERLLLERQQADDRLRDEREHADRARFLERQSFAVAALLDRIAEIQIAANELVGVDAGYPIKSGRQGHAQDVLASLQRAAHTEALMLGDEDAASRVHVLVRLALSAARYDGGASEERKRWVGDLRNYAIYVRLTLKGLLDGQPIGDPGTPQYPNLLRTHDQSLWVPTNTPANWSDAVQTDPEHPQFRRIGPPSP
jgi:hypothetical protein